MINLILKQINGSDFEVTFYKNGIQQQIVITENKTWVKEISGFISHITSDNPDFYDIWGDIEIRKYVGRKIKEFSIVSELQTA